MCKIDGAEWKSNQRGGGFFYSPSTGREYIRLAFANGFQEIQLYINAPYDQPSYLFNKNTGYYPNTIFPEDNAFYSQSYPTITPEEVYVTNAVDTGRVEILLIDPITNKIKGTFFFTGKDNRTGQKRTITDGNFDYHQ